MNNMKVIISDDRKSYRVIVTQEEVPEDIPCYLLCYKVQIQVWFFWITIKEFKKEFMTMIVNFVKQKILNFIIK